MPKRAIIEKGDRFGRLAVLREADPRFSSGFAFRRFECVCDCGTVKAYDMSSLRRGYTKSCGCIVREMFRTHGGSKTRLYLVFRAIHDRCERTNYPAYKDYGGRGIRVCEEWRSFASFRDWALQSGYQEGLSIERKDVNGSYEPANCCWIPRSEQARNTRMSRRLEAFGETKILADWARDPRCRVTLKALELRLGKGWPVEDALATPRTDHDKRRRPDIS